MCRVDFSFGVSVDFVFGVCVSGWILCLVCACADFVFGASLDVVFGGCCVLCVFCECLCGYAWVCVSVCVKWPCAFAVCGRSF